MAQPVDSILPDGFRDKARRLSDDVRRLDPWVMPSAAFIIERDRISDQLFMISAITAKPRR